MDSGADRSSIPARFSQTARRRGDAVCLWAQERHWTFRELERAASAVAGGLAALGVAAGDRVGLLAPNGAEFVQSYLGILGAGATVVPLNTLLNPREMAFILADAGVEVLVHHQSFAPTALAIAQGLPAALRRICIGEEADPDVTRFADLIACAHPAPVLTSDARTDVAVILYTSGTTGRPKGAMLTHGNLLANTASVAAALGFTDQDRLLVVLPMFHAFAATVGMLTPLLEGASLVPVVRFEPKLVTQAIATHGATIFLGVPSMYGVLLRMEDALIGSWSSVRLCVSGGAAMPVALMSAFESRFAVPICEGDGPTECGPVTSVNPPAGPRKPGSIGLPIPGVEMQVRDLDGRGVADGEMGEICVRGPSVMQGYLGLPEQTCESFFGDWFRTGDLGYRDTDGYFFLVDRLKDLVITNGMNVYPRVIEESLHANPEVLEAAVVGDPDPRHGEVPVAHVVLRPDSSATAATLRVWCREHLGQHEVPRRILIHAALPRNAAGKILKRELRRTGEYERGVVADAGVASAD